MSLTVEDLKTIRDICNCKFDPQKPVKQLSHCELSTKLVDEIERLRKGLVQIVSGHCGDDSDAGVLRKIVIHVNDLLQGKET